MGSVASYSAGVCARYKRDINVKTPNTDKEIEDFLQLKGNFYYEVPCSYEDIKQDTTKETLGFVFRQDEETFTFLFNNVNSTYETIEEFLDDCDVYSEDREEYFRLIQTPKEALKYVNLEILKEYNYFRKDVDIIVYLTEISDSIYFDRDNSQTENIILSKRILKDLSEGKCSLELYGTGDVD